jgi:hypothetical protein
VELGQDVEELDLDRTLYDITSTRNYLAQMLDSMAQQVGLEYFSTVYFSQDGLLALTLASGGVPRHYLTTLVEAIAVARSAKSTKWITPTSVYKGARVTLRAKLTALREDVGADAMTLESVFQDLVNFCLKTEKKTAFLISHDEIAVPEMAPIYELLKQLVDFKLIHLIEPDTSAASGRTGRFEAYTLDFALFMEPRLRGIELVEFWATDEQRRRRGLREAPIYPLSRALTIAAAGPPVQTEALIDELPAQVGIAEPVQ